MTQTKYDQKKRECWRIYAGAFDIKDEIPNEAFKWVFERAYALGKEKEDATTQQDYKSSELECWCDFCNTEIARKNSFDRALVKAANNFAFFRGYRFGKHEKDAYAVIQGWVARDANGSLYAYCQKPKRNFMKHLWEGEIMNISLSDDMLPDLTWESEPIEVELIIKRKKK